MTVTDGSDLVATPGGVEKFAGAPLLNDANHICEDIGSGDDFAAIVDSALVGLDLLGIAMDPFGSLFGEVAGYIIEHIGFLNEFMDDLTGDTQGIEAASETWKNIADKLFESASSYSSSLNSLSAGWNDPAAAAYSAAATSYIGSCYALGGYAYAFSEGVTVAGMICAATRQEVYDLIGDFITEMVIEGLAALAGTVFSFGASIGVWIAAMEVQGDLVAASISEKISVLLGKMGKFASKFAKDAEAFGKLGDKLTEASTEFKKGAAGLKKEASELQERADGIHQPPGSHRAAGHPGPGTGTGGDHLPGSHRGEGHPHVVPDGEAGKHLPEKPDTGPLEHTHEGTDIGLRGARDEDNAHKGEEGGGENEEGGE